MFMRIYRLAEGIRLNYRLIVGHVGMIDCIVYRLKQIGVKIGVNSFYFASLFLSFTNNN